MKHAKLWEMIAQYPDKDIGAPASEAQIAEIETALGIKIQGGYRAFLRRYAWMRLGHIEILGYGNGVPERLNVITITLEWRADFEADVENHLLPIQADGAGNYFCLPYTEGQVPEPPVVIWDHETGQVESIEGENFVEWLADRVRRVDDWRKIQIDTSQ